MAIAKFACNDDEKNAEVGNARRQTPVFLNEPTCCILPNSSPEDYMTQTNPAIFSPRLEGVGYTDHFKRARSVMIPNNPARQAHAEGFPAPGGCRPQRVRHTQWADSRLVNVIRPIPRRETRAHHGNQRTGRVKAIHR
jgi:hypothetical protein